MKAVKGSIVASKPVSLSKAAAIISRFADSGSCFRRDVSAHVRRASAAFDELVLAHRELRAARKRSELLDADEPRKKKKRKSRDGDDGGAGGEDSARKQSSGFGLAICGAVDRSGEACGGDEGKQHRKRRKLADAEEQRRVLFAVKDENVAIPDGQPTDRGRESGYEAASFGDIGVIGLETTSEKGTKKKSNRKEKNPDAANSDERSDLAGLQEENAGTAEEEKSKNGGKGTKERKRKDAWVGEERHVKEEEEQEEERKKVVLRNHASKENKVDVEDERYANSDKKRKRNKKIKEGSLEEEEEQHVDEDKRKRKNENELDSIEEKQHVDGDKKKMKKDKNRELSIDQREKGNTEETLHSLEDKKRKREAAHQEEDAGKRRKKKKMIKEEL